MAIITINDLSNIREKHSNQKIVFCAGTFDLLHAGHILFLEDCKAQGDILVVGTGRDEIIRKLKGEGRPVLNENIRLKILDSLKPVNYCFLEQANDWEHPLEQMGRTFQLLKPDIYAVNDDAFDMDYRKKLIAKYSIKMVIFERHSPPEYEKMSSTKIIEKLKAD